MYSVLAVLYPLNSTGTQKKELLADTVRDEGKITWAFGNTKYFQTPSSKCILLSFSKEKY